MDLSINTKELLAIWYCLNSFKQMLSSRIRQVYSTSIHPSRMRTARWLTLSAGEQVCLLREEGGLPAHGIVGRQTPMNRQTPVKILPFRNFVCGL